MDSETERETFRDILVAQSHTFEQFYNEIMRSFQFTGREMASFYVSNDNWDKGHEISWMDLSMEGSEEDEDVPSVMSKTPLSEFISEPDQKFILVYDFMRMWIFLIELIGYEKEAPNQPMTVLTVGTAPPEDAKNMSLGDEDDRMESEEEDDWGFEDFDDGMDEDDYDSLNDFDNY